MSALMPDFMLNFISEEHSFPLYMALILALNFLIDPECLKLILASVFNFNMQGNNIQTLIEGRYNDETVSSVLSADMSSGFDGNVIVKTPWTDDMVVNYVCADARFHVKFYFRGAFFSIIHGIDFGLKFFD
jgi:hypothetical protein